MFLLAIVLPFLLLSSYNASPLSSPHPLKKRSPFIEGSHFQLGMEWRAAHSELLHDFLDTPRTYADALPLLGNIAAPENSQAWSQSIINSCSEKESILSNSLSASSLLSPMVKKDVRRTLKNLRIARELVLGRYYQFMISEKTELKESTEQRYRELRVKRIYQFSRRNERPRGYRRHLRLKTLESSFQKSRNDTSVNTNEEFIEYIKRLQTTPKETPSENVPDLLDEETSDPLVSDDLAARVFYSLGLNREEYEGMTLLAANNLILERARLIFIDPYFKGTPFSICYWNGMEASRIVRKYLRQQAEK
jgi:hypothetical protein